MSDITEDSAAELLAETRELGRKVDNLSKRMTVAHDSVQRLKKLTIAAIILMMFSLCAGVGIAKLYVDVQQTQVTSCENRNEAARANKTLWLYVLTVSQVNSRADGNTQSQDFFKSMRAYVTELYAPRDCSDLRKKYPAPEPPRVPAHR